MKDQRISDYEEGQRAVLLRVVEKQIMTNSQLDSISGRAAFLALAESIRDSLNVHNYVPSVAWGSRKDVAAWMGHEGLKGFKSEPAVTT